MHVDTSSADCATRIWQRMKNGKRLSQIRSAELASTSFVFLPPNHFYQRSISSLSREAVNASISLAFPTMSQASQDPLRDIHGVLKSTQNLLLVGFRFCFLLRLHW